MLTLLLVAITGTVFSAAPERIGNDHLVVEYTRNGPIAVRSAATNEVLIQWAEGADLWHITLPGVYQALSPGTPVLVEASAVGQSVTLVYDRTEAPAMQGIVHVSMHKVDDQPAYVELSLQLTNRSEQVFDLAEFPANMIEQGGSGAFLVYPYNSGVLLPLDDSFKDMKIFDVLPFVNGYPSNLMSMQWMGVQRGESSYMVMSTDRYGSLKRFGAVPSDKRIGMVSASHVGLEPGDTVSLPSVRIVHTGSGGYASMALEYRRWVQERLAPGGVPTRDTVNGVEKVPLQFVSLDAKRTVRPHLELFCTTHGYPEHVVRPAPDGSRFACMPYGTVIGCMRVFEETYGSRVVPQLWSFTRSEEDGGWPLLPVDPVATESKTVGERLFPGLSLSAFLSALAGQGDHAVLYVNPTFMRQNSPDYDPAHMFDTTGQGRIMMGGLAAMASEDSAYVSPGLVSGYQADQLSRVFTEAGEGQPGSGALMFDSSQALGGTLFNNSILRQDPRLDLDRNPNAHYVERYGYVGRDSYVQDRIIRDLTLQASAPGQSASGEWITELTAMYLDMNAGSICLYREYPDSVIRKNNPIPVPLFQMVYGDCEYFVIRVGAASDANMGKGPDLIGAEVSRRATVLFGGIHQVIQWGGVPWSGDICGRLLGRTYLITRDNIARESIMGHRAGYRMLGTDGEECVAFHAVRESRWLDSQGRVIGRHWDNNACSEVALEAVADGILLSPLWGTNTPVTGSLERLRMGSTVTLMANGNFCVWDFSGRLEWPDLDGNRKFWVTVDDSADTPEGLSVVWDGARLSIGNGLAQARSVLVTISGQGLESLELLALPFHGHEQPDAERSGTSESVTFRVALPPAPGAVGLEVPAAVVSFG